MRRLKIRLTRALVDSLRRFVEEETVSVTEHGVVTDEERKQRLLSVTGIGCSDVDDLGENHDTYLNEIYSAGWDT